MKNDSLILTDVTYKYSKSNAPAISHIFLNVEEGISFGLVGHNGAGKTTIIKSILNLVKPQSGEIQIFNTNSKDANARKVVGYLPELSCFYNFLSVEEFLKYSAILKRIPFRELKDTVSDALELACLKKDIKTPLRQLSKGELQKVAIAQAILSAPKLLIIDEPFSGLDPIGRDEFISLIKLLKNNGTTIFLSSHLLNDVESLCDKVAILNKGELEGVYDKKTIQNSLGDKFELILVKNEESLKFSKNTKVNVKEESGKLILELSEKELSREILKNAIDAKVDIVSFHKKQATLEEMFLTLIKR